MTLTDATVHTVNYYDDYGFIGQTAVSGFNSTAYNCEAETGYGVKDGNAKGLQTGTLTATMNGNTVTGYLPTVMYYDYRGRLVQTKSGNHMGGMETEKLALDFMGNVTKRKHVHTASGKTTRTEVYTYTYDHTGRPLTTKYSLDGSAEMTLVSNEYDELGRLQSTTHNGKENLKTDYSYNVRNWMTSVSNPLYSQTMTYGYGGNINSQQWVQDGKTRSYAYTYDGLNRLTGAAYTGDGNYNTAYTYDRMGNITSLQRYDVSLVDNLTYTYNGNQLTKVEDATGNSFGFANGASTTNEYTYDNNGNLTKDSNKGISNISYNCLNLPSVVTFTDGSTITYTYSADGKKLRTVHVISGTTTTTDYSGNVLYENGVAKTLLTEAGYVDLTDNSHHFYIKDHLGNNRVVADASGTVEESNQYYPFGLLFANSNSNLQPYKYNGKELDTKNGLNWYDYGARHYDAALGRWHVVDPLAEKMYAWSPYGYCFNNPIKHIDVNGNIPFETVWDAFNITLGLNSFKNNLKSGNYWDAAVDGLGLALDAAATIIPYVPGGVSTAIKAARGADDVIDAVNVTNKADNAISGLKNADVIQEGKNFEKAELGKAISEGKNVRGQVRLVPENGVGNVKGNRSTVDQLIRNEDGTYSIVETKLRSTTPMSKGQKATQLHVGTNGGRFEIRTEIPEWRLHKGRKIEVKDYNRKDKYE